MKGEALEEPQLMKSGIDALYVVVSLSSNPDEPETAPGVPTVRAWRIVDGDVFEVELLVDGGEAAS